jgi:spore germination cell wall hydrolase CwlJ-like protein
MSLMPRQIGYQDLIALQARHPELTQRMRAALASPFGTIHAATFSLPRPVGTLIPEPPRVQLASLALGDSDITAAIGSLHRPRLEFPAVNRKLKGDLLVLRGPKQQPPPEEGGRDLTPGRVKTVSFPKPADIPPVEIASVPPVGPELPEPRSVSDAAGEVPPPRAESAIEGSAPDPEAGIVTAALTRSASAEPQVAAEAASTSSDDAPGRYQLAALPAHEAANDLSPLLDPVDRRSPAVRLGRLYFGGNPVGEAVGPIQPWPDDEQLVIQAPANDPDIKRSANTPAVSEDHVVDPQALAPQSADPDGHTLAANHTIASKGEVTGPDRRPKTPAERLGLDTKARIKAEKCLAEAVYFESRGESKRGQIAVAQVVMNRVFSGFYPSNVCGVVYQNAHRKFACQFTFACDNVRDVVNEPDMWQQAKGIARDMLDGKLWLPEVGHSTHYHAYWVHPAWVREMRRMRKIGVHSFYRPRAWGDGSDAPPLGEPEAADAGKKAKL